jgi:hypothetical protein
MLRRVLIGLAAAVSLAGCGLGAGTGTSDVSLTVTRGFGSHTVATVNEKHTAGSETVMRLLERSFKVDTRYGGGFVQAINGIAGDASRHDWFYYVNGVQAPQGAATTSVHKGDHIWWDLHDWTATNSVPAVVGSFPEPFLHGSGGRRYPTTLECGAGMSAICSQVASQMHSVGVPAASQAIGTGSGNDSLAIVVGTWSQVKALIAANLLAVGPQRSGVYARFARGGAALQLLDAGGHVARTLGAGAGLIAATRDDVSAPTWLITGTDLAGVASAAGALTAPRLRNHFALAVAPGGTGIPVPIGAGR